MSLGEFLLARIGEDEEVAKLAAEHVAPFYIYADGVVGQADGEWDDGTPHLRNRHTDYTLMYDPARVLAECAAKRAIVERHHPDRQLENWYWSQRECAECGHRWHGRGTSKIPTVIGPETGCSTIRALAAVYASHEDYDPDWA